MTGGSRALLRVARRALLRDRWRAILVVVLIGLPVAGITSAALILQTALPTPEERATREMGRADLQVMPIDAHGRADLAPLLPAGSTVEPIWFDSDRAVLVGSRPAVGVLYADLDGLAAGMLETLDGRPPSADDEVAISPALAERAGVGIGGTLELERTGEATVVGIVEDPRNLTRLVVLGPAGFAEGSDRVPAWLVALPPGASATDVRDRIGLAVDPQFADSSGQPMFYAWTRDDLGEASESTMTFIILLGSLALVEAALVASAAFAVGIRRRQRELGVLGAAGATPRQLAGAVLAEGLVAGLVAIAMGLVSGLAIAFVASRFLEDLMHARTGPLELDPGVLVLAAAVGLAAATAAAAVPAWGAMRLPTLAALSGRRPPSTPARRLLALGIVLIITSLVCVSAPLTLFLDGGLATPMFAIGAVVGVLGFGAVSPWLLERLEGVASHLPLAPRVALRDTARARTRNGPIVTAVLASMAATIALAGVLASQAARAEADWVPPTTRDAILVGGSSPVEAARQVATALEARGWGPLQAAVKVDQGVEWPLNLLMPLRDPLPDGDVVEGYADVLVGDAGLLTALHGEAALDAFENGSVVVLHGPQFAFTGETARVVLADGSETELGTVSVRPVAVDDPLFSEEGNTPRAIMSLATAHALGLESESSVSLATIRLDRDLTARDIEQAAALAVGVVPDAYVIGPLRPTDPTDLFRLAVLVAAILVALSVTAISVALGEAEARADQRTLLALGAPRDLRRRITAARGLVITVLAGVLAIPAGLVPVWGVLAPRNLPIVVPVPEIIGALVVLPIAAIVGGLVLGRPLPEWAARHDGGG